MPHYEFICNACKKTFSETLTIAEHDTEKTACPHCGSQDRTMLVYLLCSHLKEERLNTA